MPNTRRRRFSVQNDICSRDSSKLQNSLHGSYQDIDQSRLATANSVPMKSTKSKNKMLVANSSRISSNLKIVAETASTTATIKSSATAVDKNVAASSSTIDLTTFLIDQYTPNDLSNNDNNLKEKLPNPKDTRLGNKDNTQKRDKFPRPHRIKVRSPRRRPPILEQTINEIKQRSVEIAPVDWDQEIEVEHVTGIVVVTNDEQPGRVSDHSLDDMCRICHSGEALSSELGQLISACSCRGTVGRVHIKCLERWLTESGKSRCELCGTRYLTKRVHKYGVPKSLLMWILSQNAKQLMVDSLGIMLMSPLAVLAAWLSGRTLAGLMRQDNHSAPWPLASTFVLACMTLVCYYCWIVSAATRHALGWWIWYRSQYEVRLQLQETED